MKVGVTIDGLKTLAMAARQNDKRDHFIDMALEWAGAATAEIERVYAENEQLQAENELSKTLAHHIINLPTAELDSDALDLAHKVLSADAKAADGGEE